MEVDAGRCAAVGPSGPDGFERRSARSFHNLVSIAQQRSHAEELDFQSEPANWNCLRRCEAQGVSVSGAFPTLVRGSGIAHLVCAVAKATRIFTIRRGRRRVQHYEKSPDTGGIERFRLIAFLKGAT